MSHVSFIFSTSHLLLLLLLTTTSSRTILCNGFSTFQSSITHASFAAVNKHHGGAHLFRTERYKTLLRQSSPSTPHDGNIRTKGDDEEGEESTSSFLTNLLSRFQGDFDNYKQVLSDRKEGLLPRESGGHEHFHCTFVPIPQNILPPSLLFGSTTTDDDDDNSEHGTVLAAYYLDGMPQRIFRLRLYIFSDSVYQADDDSNRGEDDDGNGNDSTMMKIYCINPALEGKLRATSENALASWCQIVQDYILTSPEDGNDAFVELERCDIKWTKTPHPTRHSFLKNSDCGDAFHAIMIYDHEKGGVRLESQMSPGSYIRVQDELSLWDDALWINDRGFDDVTGDRVYGNWNGVPYKMERVSRLISPSLSSSSEKDEDDKNMKWDRGIVDPTLTWTLGNQWRTDEEYEAKMEAIGGITSRLK